MLLYYFSPCCSHYFCTAVLRNARMSSSLVVICNQMQTPIVRQPICDNGKAKDYENRVDNQIYYRHVL